MKTHIKYHILTFFLSVLLTTPSAFAYLSVSETGELLKEGNFRLGVIPQVLIANGGGTNVAAFLDMPVSPDVNSRFIIGGGKTDFWASGSAKWVPYPDYERQPAIGFRGSVIYARDENFNFYNFQVTPIISKIVESEYGKMNPYIGLPVTLMFSDNTSVTGVQFVVGNEWISKPEFQIGAELDLNLSKTTSAITVHINFPFDAQQGYRK